MNNLNQIIIEGKIAMKLKLNQSSTVPVCSMVISYERSYKNNIGEFAKETSDFEIIIYGSMGEFVFKQFKSGDEIRCIGRLKQNKWIDENEEKHSAINIIAEHIEKLGARNEQKTS